MNKCGVLAAGILLCLLTGPPFADDMQGVVMKDGTMMTMADSKATAPMQKEMTTTDGTVKKTDGTTSHLQNGQMMTKDGKMMNAHEVKGMEKGMQMKDKGMSMGKAR